MTPAVEGAPAWLLISGTRDFQVTTMIALHDRLEEESAREAALIFLQRADGDALSMVSAGDRAQAESQTQSTSRRASQGQETTESVEFALPDGKRCRHPADRVIERASALRALEHFFYRGTLAPWISWETWAGQGFP